MYVHVSICVTHTHTHQGHHMCVQVMLGELLKDSVSTEQRLKFITR